MLPFRNYRQSGAGKQLLEGTRTEDAHRVVSNLQQLSAEFCIPRFQENLTAFASGKPRLKTHTLPDILTASMHPFQR